MPIKKGSEKVNEALPEKVTEGKRGERDEDKDVLILSEALENVPEEIKKLLISQSMEVRYSGLLPMGDAFAKYEGACPGAGKRILRMAEKTVAHELEEDTKDREHRRNLLEKNQEQKRFDARAGMVAAFVITICILVASWHLISTGHDWAGSIMVGVTLITLVIVFRLGRMPPTSWFGKASEPKNT